MQLTHLPSSALPVTAKAFNLLVASKAKHKTLLCVTCHQEKHKMVPKCQDCHGVPHAAGMMSKFPKCADCHGIAHDLNNWNTAPAAAAPAAAEETCCLRRSNALAV